MTAQLLTIAQCCEALQVDRRFVRAAIASHTLRATNLGTDSRPVWRIDDRDLRRFIDAGRT